jgi:oligopeptide/dipeptide ABC transporter ATP-binding protein
VSAPARSAEAPALLEVRGLRAAIFQDGRIGRAVDGVGFEVRAGETVAMLGESGCGKTLTALSLLQLAPSPPARITGGEALFRGRDLLAMSSREVRRLRGREIAMVFQEPMTSLNPVLRVGFQVAEALRAHERVSRRGALARAVELLSRVGIPDARRRAQEYPHQMSGGMKQRAMIAMALIGRPALLIADEPTTALDVTTQAQIIELLRELQRDLGMALLIITHDLGVAAELADRIVVLYAGKVVESAPALDFFEAQLHPYSAGLFGSFALRGPRERLRVIPGEVPDPFAHPGGCRFHPRCPLAVERCRLEEPPLAEAAPGRWSACWRLEDGRLPPVVFPEAEA